MYRYFEENVSKICIDYMKRASPLTQHEQDSLHFSLLGSRVKLTWVEPQFLLPGRSKQDNCTAAADRMSSNIASLQLLPQNHLQEE